MKTEGGKKDIKIYGQGANRDLDREFLGNKNEGEYIDARNMHPVSVDGHDFALEKIKGEASKYTDNLNVGGDWFCMGAIEVNGNIVELWADKDFGFNSLIRINGVIVLQHADFPISYSNPLQMDRNENCIGGEIFITDNSNIPMIYNIQDMIDEVGNQTYFTDYNHSLYTINLDHPLDIPVFVGLESVGGGGGLPVGTYQYALRYVTSQGDRTNPSEFTQTIPVVRNLNYDSDIYPAAMTYGDSPDPLSPTRYGIKLRFRITNLYNYESVELIRRAYNQGGGVDFTTDEHVIARIGIEPQEISVKEFLDPSQSNLDEVIVAEELSKNLMYIEKAQAIRYFDKRLVLANITTPTKEASLVFSTSGNGNTAFPVIRKLHEVGHNDPYNFSNYKAYIGGEKYGFGIQLYDVVGSKGFVSKLTDFENYQFPNRRVATEADTETYSYNKESSEDRLAGSTVSTYDHDNDGTDDGVANTHEIFDLNNAIAKTDGCEFKNIIKGDVSTTTGTKTPGKLTSETLNAGVDFMVDCNETDGEIENHGATITSGGGYVHAGYSPYHPVNEFDKDVTGHNYRNAKAIDPNGGGSTAYNPKAFSPSWYSMGLGITGITSFPDWAKAFSVVRTDPANRVICQGIGFYKILQADKEKLNNNSNSAVEKSADTFWFYSPDIYSGLVSESVMQDMMNNPLDYSIQCVSPLGFFSDIYSFDKKGLIGFDRREISIIIPNSTHMDTNVIAPPIRAACGRYFQTTIFSPGCKDTSRRHPR